ncbi:DNA/RNA-binding domain E.t1.c1-type [Penicillium antarcticum]|uniref:DNA/RNA-binding domain E.t1.c1-type n=1 Tax=Penicillium antarcticum TaxID=416450 RepID=UPI0023843244|nr:DNA/RNA-binding domain E.t1.c1-type [Penicillium antarcticum]KAJ5317573.1 DNA/RNA-binding domain E.t1.c1-type [Penicillium antarcticum]
MAVQGTHDNSQHQAQRALEHDMGKSEMKGHNSYPDYAAFAQEANPQMIKQLETNPITEEHLTHEVRAIYDGLVKVEKKCIEVIKYLSQMGLRTELSQDQWSTVISLHRMLLHEHHDFFLASQHPSASPAVKHLAEKYAMPARMWRYGIHSCLELLRKRLPASLDHMLAFIYLSYSTMTLLLESVPHFRGTWIECLGDLARYRMAVEDTDVTDRDIWAGVSKYWYNQDTDACPETGRIQHHLAVLSRPDTLQQFFYYTKALISVRPFANARVSIAQLFNPILSAPADRHTLITSFVAAHGALFMRMPVEHFVARSKFFLSNLRQEVSRLGREGQQGVFITSCNIAAIFQYGDNDGVFATEFTFDENTTADAYAISRQWASTTTPIDPNNHQYTDLASQFAFRASSLAFHTLIIILGQAGDPNLHPSVHASMAFVWCLTLIPAAIQRLEPLVPWTILANYLNTLLRPDINIAKIEDESFPRIEDTTSQQLPEDFLIRGQTWSRLYYPGKFFEETAIEDDRPLIGEPSTMLPRRHRCLWLGVRIATFSRWMTYDQTRLFTPTRLAHEFAPIAQSTDHLSGNIYLVPGPVNQEMEGV